MSPKTSVCQLPGHLVLGFIFPFTPVLALPNFPSRAGILEPGGTVEIKFRKKDLVKTMRRIDTVYAKLVEQLGKEGEFWVVDISSGKLKTQGSSTMVATTRSPSGKTLDVFSAGGASGRGGTSEHLYLLGALSMD